MGNSLHQEMLFAYYKVPLLSRPLQLRARRKLSEIPFFFPCRANNYIERMSSKQARFVCLE